MAERRKPTQEQQKPEWADLLETALTMPGNLGNTYSRFYNYSLMNQVWLYRQGVAEPVNTYKRWLAMDRQVKRGSKAKSVWAPMIKKETDEKGQESRRLLGFKLMNSLFTVSETEGEPLPEYEPKDWCPERALGALAIHRVTFDLVDGNTQGYSRDREVAINPVAKYPLKTLAHEIGHIEAGHTAQEKMAEYATHRGLFEFEAEGSAFLVMNEVDAEAQHYDPAESRHYIQSWLQGERPEDQSIRRVFSTADRILKAGREPDIADK